MGASTGTTTINHDLEVIEDITCGVDTNDTATFNGVVNIEMLGACQGCPLSIATLKSGIERILMDKVPGVEQVIAT